MADSCRLAPVVFKRNGTKIEEVDSKLFKDIKEAVKDHDTAWKMWAFTKTAEFKRDYKNLEYDELGEVTFPSLIKALGLEKSYNEQKDREQAERDYGFTNTVYKDAGTATEKIEEFNKKEKKFTALMQKEADGFSIHVVKKTPGAVREARQQSYNHALTGEIIDMLRSMGFDVSFASNPRYAGLFDPTNATLKDGLIEIIRIAKGERGEEALPEEFSHLIIEGLQNHPLVQRLFLTLNSEQIIEILGDQYEDYYNEYEGDPLKLKKEAAGKLLAEHIKQKGTIRKEIVAPKKHLLSRIWEWAKNLFSKISHHDIEDAGLRAHNYIADIYNLITTDEVIPIIDKHAVMDGDKLFLLNKRFDQLDKTAHEALTIHARMIKLENNGGVKRLRDYKDSKKAHTKIAETVDTDEYECIAEFLRDTMARLNKLQGDVRTIKRDQDKGFTEGIKELKRIAKVVRAINTFTLGYDNIIRAIATFDEEDNTTKLGLSEEGAERLAKMGKQCLENLNSLTEFVQSCRRNIVFNMSRTQYKDDKVKGIGRMRDEIMSLDIIINHAERDINFVDRYLSAMSDADDALLTIIDGLVKNQQYARDMDMIDLKAQIDVIDQALRKAGYTSEFMYEKDEHGVPRGRIISQYDWDAYNKDRTAYQELLASKGITGTEYYKEMQQWQDGYVKINGVRHRRMIEVYVDPEYDRLYRAGEKDKIPEDAITERMPNPKVYSGKADTLERLAPAQREYYDKMLTIKRQMMTKIPHRGQGIYKTINISKDLVEGILDNSAGNPVTAVLDNYKRKFLRRPDDLGFGVQENFREDITNIINNEPSSQEAAESIVQWLKESVDDDIIPDVSPRKLKKIIDRYQRNKGKENEISLEDTVKEIVETINSENFYEVDTDFANHRIQKLPIYYSRPLKDKKMLSTDFTGTLVAYSAMALNYEKMDEVVDILEVAREYINDPEGRKVLEREGDAPVYAKFNVFGKAYRSFVEKASSRTNIAARLDDYMAAVVYEERKENEGTIPLPFNVNLDYAKTLDAIKDYTGLIGLGFNIFSTFSNLTVGKLQQWIEAIGGEYFTVKDYAKAVVQYSELMPGCLAEMNSPVKTNKLSLLIQMFDPMGDYFESMRDPNYSKSAVSRILGNGVLAYIGMNAGEHILHCQTMLAILNNVKLENTKTGEKISLFDALEVKKGEDGVTRLVLMEDLAYRRELIDNTGDSNPNSKNFNKNYGKPLKDETGKIVTELVSLNDKDNYRKFIFKKKRIVRKVNDSLNGAFSANDKGAAHRMAVWRLILQFRQWMPAHYMRRFARAHYDADLEQWREGYYLTEYKVLAQMGKELIKGKTEALKLYSNLSEHERANLRRANAEISMFFILMALCKFGGRVKDRDRSWLDKMALYQIHRMYLEVGASMPSPAFASNIIQLLQSPAAAVGTLEKFTKVLNFFNMWNEIQSGRYQGWSEWERDAFQAIPALGQISKALDFDDSMFAMFEIDD